MINQTGMSLAERSLGELVREDGRAAQVFETFGLDFCCNGRRTLREAATAQSVPLEAVISGLEHLGPPTSDAPAEWQDLGALIRHILDRHHTYVRTIAPTISAWLDRLVDRHGERHAELAKIRDTFSALAHELTTHMVKEENILFPYIQDLAAAEASGTGLPPGPFGSVANPVRVMEADHALAGELSAELRTLSGGFVPPEDGCTTYRLCFAELENFERDLHQHIHLENNILFPGALELEQRLG